MLCRHLKVTLPCLFLLGLATFAQIAAPVRESFPWQRGQAVFVEVLYPSGTVNEEVTERLRKAFEKENVFLLAPTPDRAQFVFLVYSTTNSFGTPMLTLRGFALTPAQYREAKGDLDTLRTVALWQAVEDEGRVRYIPERLSGRFAQRFHQEIAAPAVAPTTTALTPVTRRIYITAFYDNGQPDLELEDLIKERFAKFKVFTFATAPAQAELVFVTYHGTPEEDAMTTFALPPEEYLQNKNDFDALYEKAWWSGHSQPGRVFVFGNRLMNPVIEKFHEQLPTLGPKPSAPLALPTTPTGLQPGQSVYLVGYRVNGRPDVAITNRLREAFQQQSAFPLARRLSEAQIIFLVIADVVPPRGAMVGYRYLESGHGYVLAASHYKQSKGNPDALRERSYWHQQIDSSKTMKDARSLSLQLVTTFMAEAGQGTPSPTIAVAPTDSSAASSVVALASPAKTADKMLPRDLKEAKKFEQEATQAFENGEFEKALTRAQAVLEVKEKQLGADHQELIVPLNLLAQAATARGEYQAATDWLQRALTLSEKSGAPLKLAETLNNWAALQMDKGDFQRAEEWQQHALLLWERAVPPAPVGLSRALHQTALIALAQNRLTEAETLLTRAQALQEKQANIPPREQARTLHTLATLYVAKGEDTPAEPLYLRVLELVSGKGLAVYRVLLAITDNRYRKKTEAERIAEEPFRLTPLLFRSSPYLVHTLNSLAALRLRQGRLTEVGWLLDRAVTVTEKTKGKQHLDLALTYDNYALLHRAKGNVFGALEAKLKANEIVEANLRRNLLGGSEREKSAYLARFAGQLDAVLSLHWVDAANNLNLAQAALTLLLRHKARLLDANSDVLTRLRRNADPHSQALLEQLAATRAELAKLMWSAPGATAPEAVPQRMQQLQERMETLEAELAQRSQEFRREQTAITFESVQAMIPAEMALVEFARFRPESAKSSAPGEPRYVAYVLPQQGQVRWVDLGTAAEIDRAIADWRTALQAKSPTAQALARALDERVMRPVRALLGTTRAVLLAPDGQLNLVPFAALVDEDNRYLIERFSFTYLTSGRDLLRLQQGTANTKPALILAAPDFGPASSPAASLTFTPLFGAAEEGKAIQALLPEAVLLTQAQATETALKQAQSPGILHIATHGFFLAQASSSAPDAAQQRSLLSPAASDQPLTFGAQWDNPLLRSGLGLAGANARNQSGEDGILTAYEATTLNLTGTKLVALSACETGVGEIKNGDGVHGLRRALVLAGAETQVMSLWQVDDKATQELMTAYYKRLLAGQGRSEALRQVQLEMLGQRKEAATTEARGVKKIEGKTVGRNHPYYWASFIPSGEWANLAGQR